MRPKIRCDGKSTVLLQNFLDLNWTIYAEKEPRDQNQPCDDAVALGIV
jgi:hypothetical protein